MRYTNSGLVGYTKISPNRTSPRVHRIDRITPHCYVGQVSAESMAGWLCNPAAQASANYGIADNGTIAMFVEEQDRSWCSSNRDNDMRAITIECASDVKEPYAINDNVYNRLIDLMTDICKRHGKTKLLWLADKEKTLAYQPLDDEMVITVHRWFANKTCPGDYIYNRLGKIAETVTKRLGGLATAPQEEQAEYTQSEWIAMIAPIAQDLARKYSVLPSVIIAQTALETGWGSTDLTRKYNIIGMKADLINSTWKEHSTWDGEIYTKVTPEYVGGQLIHKEDVFRVYHSFRECLEDYVNFLLYVRNGKRYKYRRIQNMADPAEVINVIRIGTGTDKAPEGYCTDPNYEAKVLKLIKDYNLTKYDSVMAPKEEQETKQAMEPVAATRYRVQVGAYRQKGNATQRMKQIKKQAKLDSFMEYTDLYRVYCGSFESEENAKARVNILDNCRIKGAFVVKA